MTIQVKHRLAQLLTVSIFNLSMIGFSMGASAQAAAVDQPPIEEILVTARKIEESVQDIPLAITAFTAQDIQERSIEELEDVALLTPGLTFEDYSNGGFGTPVIRGASQFSIDALEQNVSTFVDGVYIPRQYAIDLGVVNLERIEVVKGPQSALYGANAFLGAINYVTRKADLEEMFIEAGLVFGSDGRQDISADVSVPIVKDRLAVKVNYAATEFDGDWDNDHPAARSFSGRGTDEDFGGYDNDTIGVSLVAKPVDQLKIELGWNRYETELESRAQTRLGLGSLDLNCGAVAFFTFPRVFCGELPDAPVVPGGNGIETGFSVDPRSYSETESDIVRAAVRYDFNERMSIDYQYSNIETDIFAPGNADRVAENGTVPFGGTEPMNFFTVLPSGNFEYESHELRFEFAADNGIYAMIGFFTSEVEDLDDGDAGFAAPLFTTSLEPIVSASLPATRNNNFTENDTNAIFARVSVPLLDDKLVIAVEGRYTDEEKTASDPTGEFVFEDEYFTPRVSVDYHFTDDILVYASYAEGTKSGGINPAVVTDAAFQLVPLPANERFYDADENTTIEVGLRSSFLERRLQFNATLFYIDWSDLQVSVAADGAGPFTQVITGNLGSAESQGLEMDLNFALTGSLTFNAGLALIDATYDSGTISQRIVRAGLCDDVVCNSNGDIGGNDLPRSSDTQWNVGLQYDTTIAGGIGLFARADLVGQSDQYVAEINTAEIPSRTLLNLRAGLKGEHWEAELWAKNATDEEYVSNAFYIPSPFFVDYVPTFGNQRRVGLSLSVSF